MAKGKNIAIWIILFVVLAAAAGVIVIAVQNSKRESQLTTVESAAALYNKTTNPSSSSTLSKPGLKPMGRMRGQTDEQHPQYHQLQKQQQMQQQQMQQQHQQKQQQQQQMQQKQQQQQMQQQHQQMQQQQHQQQHQQKQQPHGGRYDVAMFNAQSQLANQLPPQMMYQNNVGMTTFAHQPGPSHVMSTTPPNYPPRSGGGALFIPSQSPQAQMPAQQLFVSNNFPSTIDILQDMSNFSSVNAYAENGAVGTTMSKFVGSAYFQDPATMTPNTYADGLGLDAYMPDVSNATPEGLDPQTGLPVFSTASLKRSNNLSSRGANGFLRPTMDDTQGYKKTIGKRIQTCRYNDCDLDKRRNQFNAARINSNGEDVVLFNQTDFMYLR